MFPFTTPAFRNVSLLSQVSSRHLNQKFWLSPQVSSRHLNQKFWLLTGSAGILPASLRTSFEPALKNEVRGRLSFSLMTLAISFAMFAFSQPAGAQQQGKVLQGGVNMQQSYMSPTNGLSLNRKNIQDNGDPFSQGDAPPSEQFDAPDGSFDGGQHPPAPPPFNLNADQGQYGGQQGIPQQDQQAPTMGQQQMLPPMQQGGANDPDNSQQMQIQWEMWHRRVAEAIFVRFDGVAQRAFAQSRPIACQAAYTVTRDKQIVNVRLLHKSNNIVFNSMLLMVLKSMNGNPILDFPPGSRRQSVEKTGTFSRNCGVQGFKFTTGDAETIQGK